MNARYLFRLIVLSVALTLLPSCSLVSSEEGPKRGEGFAVYQERLDSCYGMDEGNTCTISFTANLTEKSYKQFDVTSSQVSHMKLVFGDTTSVFYLHGIPDSFVPMVPGRTYDVKFDLGLSWFLTTFTFSVADSSGLVFWASTRNHIPVADDATLPVGWKITDIGGRFESHPLDCGAYATPRMLEVSHGDRTVRLHQGQVRTLDGYTVMASIAENVNYEKVECLDYSVMGFSVAIARNGD